MFRRQELSQTDIADQLSTSDYELSYLTSASSHSFSESTRVNDNDTQAFLHPGESLRSTKYLYNHGVPTSGKGRDCSLPRAKVTYDRIDAAQDQLNVKTPVQRGWRRAVITAGLVTALVLLINIIFAITAHLKFGDEDGVGTIYRGDCNVVKRWNTALHLGINVLATVLLAASSYTMQCLNSPTRSEVDAAHARGVSLDIGIPNFNNFKYMAPWKTVLWLILCLSTIPLHLLWNSTVIMTGGTNLFNYVAVEPSFFVGPTRPAPPSFLIGSNTTLVEREYSFCNDTQNMTIAAASVYDMYVTKRYTNITAAECLTSYMQGDGSSLRNLILICTENAPLRTNQCNFPSRNWNRAAIMVFGKDIDPRKGPFIMDVLPSPYDLNTNVTFVLRKAREQIAADGTWNLGPHLIQSCMSERGSFEHCQLQYVSYILYVVIISNLIKVLCMIATARYLWNLDEPILATVGDAVASFLRREDKTTTGWCLLDSTMLKRMFHPEVNNDTESLRKLDSRRAAHKKFTSSQRREHNEALRDEVSLYQRQPKRRLISATSSRRWGWTIMICYIYMFSGLMFWLFAVAAAPGSSFSSAMSAKFGAVDPNMLIGWEGGSGGRLLLNVVLANSFQLLLSTTYFMYNALYTAQCAALEWASYASREGPKSLRVTWPQGQQRSTYYLQLPWRYAIPLTVMLGLMHFLISESIFLARLTYNDAAGNPRDDIGFMTVGYSPPAVITTTMVGTLMVIAQIVNAVRPLGNRIPIHGNKSMVISAVCHADEDKSTKTMYDESQEDLDLDVSTQTLMWGTTRRPGHETTTYDAGQAVDDRLAGHCTFTSRYVALPQTGQRYL